MTHKRQQRAVERILEDTGLTGDLTDGQARPLIDWACTQATRVAADTARSDAEVDIAVRAIRKAVLRVASTATNEYDAERLVSLAQQALAQTAPGIAADRSHPPTVAPSTIQSTDARPSLWQRMRQWFTR